jgi:hypothetical protein
MLGMNLHGSEFYQAKVSIVSTHPFLNKKHPSFTFQGDEKRNE